MSATKHLQGKLPLKNSVIKHCQCLNPTNRNQPWTVESVKLLAEKLSRCLDIEVDVLRDQWRLSAGEYCG